MHSLTIFAQVVFDAFWMTNDSWGIFIEPKPKLKHPAKSNKNKKLPHAFQSINEFKKKIFLAQTVKPVKKSGFNKKRSSLGSSSNTKPDSVTSEKGDHPKIKAGLLVKSGLKCFVTKRRKKQAKRLSIDLNFLRNKPTQNLISQDFEASVCIQRLEDQRYLYEFADYSPSIDCGEYVMPTESTEISNLTQFKNIHENVKYQACWRNTELTCNNPALKQMTTKFKQDLDLKQGIILDKALGFSSNLLKIKFNSDVSYFVTGLKNDSRKFLMIISFGWDLSTFS